MHKTFFLRNFLRFGIRKNPFKIFKTTNLKKKLFLAGSVLIANTTFSLARIIFFDEPKEDVQQKPPEIQKKMEGLSKLVKVFCYINLEKIKKVLIFSMSSDLLKILKKVKLMKYKNINIFFQTKVFFSIL